MVEAKRIEQHRLCDAQSSSQSGAKTISEDAAGRMIPTANSLRCSQRDRRVVTLTLLV